MTEKRYYVMILIFLHGLPRQKVEMHFVKREWRVRCNVSQIVLQQLACGRHPLPSRSTPALLHCGLPSCLPPLINIFGQVCPSDCHWSYRPRPRPVNWHWTDSGGETRRQLTSLTDFWHNFFRCQCPAHASNMYGENTIVLQFKSSKTGCIWNWQCEYCSKYHRDNRELWGSNESIKVQQFNPSYLVLRPP